MRAALLVVWLAVAAGTVWAGEKTKEPPAKPPRPVQMALADIPLPFPKGKEDELLLGVRVSGLLEVDAAVPSPKERGKWRVIAFPVDGEHTPGEYVKRGGRWVRMAVVLSTTEAVGLRIRKGMRWTLAGDVVKALLSEGEDLTDGRRKTKGETLMLWFGGEYKFTPGSMP